MKKDKIISALAGLVGAINNNGKTDNTDKVIINSLAFPLLNPDFSDDDLSVVLDDIYSEKNTIAPNCATCTAPCGNTSDYDMSRLYNAGEEIRSLKLQIISRLEKLALYAQNSDADCTVFYKGIAYVSYDLTKEMLSQLLEEINGKIKDLECLN